MAAATQLVVLLLPLDGGEARGLVRGIYHYVRPARPWLLEVRRAHALEVFAGLERMGTAGIIAHGALPLVVEGLAGIATPAVIVGGAAVPGRAWLGIDDRAIGRLAATHLLAKGVRSFACLAGGAPEALARCQAFVAHLEAIGRTCALRIQEPISLHANFMRAADLRAWLRGLPAPCGVFAASDAGAHLVADACLIEGLRIPERIALLGAGDDELICGLTHPPLASVRLPWEQVGFEAAALLDRMLAGAPAPRAPFLIDPVGVAERRSSDVLAAGDGLVAEALRHLHEQIGRRLSMPALARRLGVSARTLELRFRRALGRSPLAEHLRLRLEKAKALLADTDLPVRQVAAHTGFADPRWFASRFRREVGTTPTRYRQRHR